MAGTGVSWPTVGLFYQRRGTLSNEVTMTLKSVHLELVTLTQGTVNNASSRTDVVAGVDCFKNKDVIYHLPLDCLLDLLCSNDLALSQGEFELLNLIEKWHTDKANRLHEMQLGHEELLLEIEKNDCICLSLLRNCIRFQLLDVQLLQNWSHFHTLKDLGETKFLFSGFIVEKSLYLVHSALEDRKGIDELEAHRKWGRNVSSFIKCLSV
ncbi:unnamed protein product [Protopolystoma xenopodis]|uniref:Uncharacterized protein n=1 Tax=Protopolystoma xenopodis TaxID=117903 RepID=A0A3S5B622_9PLAT|nr:unnamed protein product [Protopolystoma xenopodis]